MTKRISKKEATKLISEWCLREKFIEGNFCTGEKSFKKYTNFPCRYSITLEKPKKNLIYFLHDAFEE